MTTRVQDEKEAVLGIISEVGFGMRDVNDPILWWTVHTDEHYAALQVFGIPKALEIIKDYGVYDVHDLNGKPVWVFENAGRITYDRAWKK